MFTVGPLETILIIAAIVIVLYSPGILPKLGRAIGEGIRSFREAVRGRPSKPKEGLIAKVAEELGLETEGKSAEELIREVAEVLEGKRKR